MEYSCSHFCVECGVFPTRSLLSSDAETIFLPLTFSGSLIHRVAMWHDWLVIYAWWSSGAWWTAPVVDWYRCHLDDSFNVIFSPVPLEMESESCTVQMPGTNMSALQGRTKQCLAENHNSRCLWSGPGLQNEWSRDTSAFFQLELHLMIELALSSGPYRELFSGHKF